MLAFAYLATLLHLINCKSDGCSRDNIRNCLKGFQMYLDKGTAFLAEVDEKEYVEICFKYSFASSCVTSFMYFCPKIKEELQKPFEKFEYACTVDRNDDPHNWPIMPTVDPDVISESEKLEATQKREKFLLSIFMTSLAAGATLLIVMICFAVSCITKWKLRRKIQLRKQKTQVDIKVMNDQEKLLKTLIDASDDKAKKLDKREKI